MTAVIEGPFLAACSLLVVAGADKVARPATTSQALATAGLPAPEWLVRSVAAVELGVGAGAALSGSSLLAAAVAVSYAGFAGFVALALVRHWPLATCGCFARIDTPPTRGHVVMNVVAGVVAGLVAATGGTSLPDALRGQPAFGIPLLATSGAVAAMTLLWISAAARLATIRTGAGGTT